MTSAAAYVAASRAGRTIGRGTGLGSVVRTIEGCSAAAPQHNAQPSHPPATRALQSGPAGRPGCPARTIPAQTSATAPTATPPTSSHHAGTRTAGSASVRAAKPSRTTPKTTGAVVTACSGPDDAADTAGSSNSHAGKASAATTTRESSNPAKSCRDVRHHTIVPSPAAAAT